MVDYDQVTCARYIEACGAGCYQENDGKPCCFVMPKKDRSTVARYIAVDYNGVTAMPGLHALRR